MTAKPKEPNIISRALSDLEEHYERGEEGKHTGYERPEVEAEEEPYPPALDADDFQELNQRFAQDKKKQHVEQREAVAEKRRERVEELLHRHVDEERWTELMRRAREAAKAGNTDFELLRFPSQLCADGGRAINIAEEGWPETLRGEALDIYHRFENDLRPQGFHLTAKILDFPGGFPGDAGLFLTWGE
jgi:hypothetical protein